MGCGTSFVCYDCKKIYYLGYGSYGSWIHADTVTEFDSKALKVVGIDSDDGPWTRDGSLRKNQNLRQCLAEHDGHKTWRWIDDYEYGTEGGTLYGMGSYGTRGTPIIENIDSYEFINLYEDIPIPPTPLPESTGNAEVDRKLKAFQERQQQK